MMQWARAGVFAKVHEEMLRFYDRRRGIKWDFASLDSALAKAPPKRGGDTGKNPTDRGKLGVKRHVLSDGRGVTLSAVITGANVHDKWMVAEVLDSIPLHWVFEREHPRDLCLDKGYDYEDGEAAVRKRGIIPHIRRRGEPALVGCALGKPRRWVVERTNSWHNRFRGLLIRWERLAGNCLPLLPVDARDSDESCRFALNTGEAMTVIPGERSDCAGLTRGTRQPTSL